MKNVFIAALVLASTAQACVFVGRQCHGNEGNEACICRGMNQPSIALVSLPNYMLLA